MLWGLFYEHGNNTPAVTPHTCFGTCSAVQFGAARVRYDPVTSAPLPSQRIVQRDQGQHVFLSCRV